MRRAIGVILLLITVAILAFRMTAHLGASDGWLFFWVSMACGIGGIRLVFGKRKTS